MRSRAVRRVYKWCVVLSVLYVGFLFCSTVAALVDVQRTHDRYPTVSYPAPSYRPEVTWSDAKPRGWVQVSQLPKTVWLAVLACEDSGFYRHRGIDPAAFAKGMRRSWQRRERPAGFSTLTQQVAKNLYFGARHPVLRKLPEAAIAMRVDAEFGKQRTLEVYLNVAEWGEGIVGIQQAARTYFGKNASQLSAREAAVLANLLPNPRGLGHALKRGRTARSFVQKVRRTERHLATMDRIVRRESSRNSKPYTR